MCAKITESSLPQVCMIAAKNAINVIGDRNKLLWNLPNDLQWFRRRTLFRPVIMGRKTYESIGHALPNRHNIVISRNPNYKLDDAKVVHSLEEALKVADDIASTVSMCDKIFIIGGGEIYQQAMPYAQRIYLTHVEAYHEGDAKFPAIGSEFQRVYEERFLADEKHAYNYTFEILMREGEPELSLKNL